MKMKGITTIQWNKRKKILHIKNEKCELLTTEVTVCGWVFINIIRKEKFYEKRDYSDERLNKSGAFAPHLFYMSGSGLPFPFPIPASLVIFALVLVRALRLYVIFDRLKRNRAGSRHKV